MKVSRDNFFLTIVFLLGFVSVHAAKTPPEPTEKSAAPIAPPGTPIDSELIMLFVLALLYGLYILHKHYFKTKKIHLL